MRVELVAVGTELLLGQIANTNARWLGEQLAARGVASHFHQVVGDNQDRMVLALRTALARSDGVIVCGGLGPTQDDITREAIAEVVNVPLERDEAIVATIAEMFASRGRTMGESNARQADVPRGASVIEQRRGTAPGLICPVGGKVIYAVPGVPYEMEEMFERAIAPDLEARQRAEGSEGVIRSRVLRTWGATESSLAEAVGPRFDANVDSSSVTIAFLASGMEGIKVRITARGATEAEAVDLLDREEVEVRKLITHTFGDIVFGVDDVSMEQAIANLMRARRWKLGLAESVTGGLIASRLVNVSGASSWFRGAVVSYASEVKFELLGVAEGPVVSEEAAAHMAASARDLLGADVGLSVTGVAGPDTQDGQPVGTVFVGVETPEGSTVVSFKLPGDRDRIRQYAAISALDALRRFTQA